MKPNYKKILIIALSGAAAALVMAGAQSFLTEKLS